MESQWFLSKELKPSCLSAPKDIIAIINRKVMNQQDLYTTRFTYDTPLVADSSGKVAVVLSANPNVASNWASYVATFDEYRVLAMESEFRPNRWAGGSSLSVSAPIVKVCDYDSIAALTGYQLAGQYSSAEESGGLVPWKKVLYMSGAENSGFVSTASPTSIGYIKTYSAGNTASIALGQIRSVFYIQFRGLGI